MYFVYCLQEGSSHSNLGAMLHLNGKASEAARSYREALRLDPEDRTTMANLRKLHALHGTRLWPCSNMAASISTSILNPCT